MDQLQISEFCHQSRISRLNGDLLDDLVICPEIDPSRRFNDIDEMPFEEDPDDTFFFNQNECLMPEIIHPSSLNQQNTADDGWVLNTSIKKSEMDHILSNTALMAS